MTAASFVKGLRSVMQLSPGCHPPRAYQRRSAAPRAGRNDQPPTTSLGQCTPSITRLSPDQHRQHDRATQPPPTMFSSRTGAARAQRRSIIELAAWPLGKLTIMHDHQMRIFRRPHPANSVFLKFGNRFAQATYRRSSTTAGHGCLREIRASAPKPATIVTTRPLAQHGRQPRGIRQRWPVAGVKLRRECGRSTAPAPSSSITSHIRTSAAASTTILSCGRLDVMKRPTPSSLSSAPRQNFVPTLKPIVRGRPGTMWMLVQMLHETPRDNSLRLSKTFVANSSTLYFCQS